jgi:hypothetical protein
MQSKYNNGSDAMFFRSESRYSMGMNGNSTYRFSASSEKNTRMPANARNSDSIGL